MSELPGIPAKTSRRAIYSLHDLRRCLIIGVGVGTLLVVVNQGPMAYGSIGENGLLTFRVALDYLIPFSVASTSACWANLHRR